MRICLSAACGAGVFEVEFIDDNGITYAMLAIPAQKLMVLRYTPETMET